MISNDSIYNKSWEKLSLEKLGTFGRGKSKHRPRDDKKLFGGKYPFIQTGDIKEANLWVSRYSKTYNEYGLSQSKLWSENTLCITIAANIAETAILSFDACFPDSVVGFESRPNKSNVYFMHYLFTYIKRKIQRATSGSVQDNINLDFLKKLQLRIPLIDEQNKIAEILLTLDEKIQLNNEINKTLEEMAQAIFKHWFVDFEFPNEDGEPYKSSGGKFVESELGRIPEGWEVKNFTEAVEVLSGGTPKTDESLYWGSDIPLFTPKDYNSEVYVTFTEKYITELGLKKCNSKLYPPNTIFITARGTVGNVCMNIVNMAMNQSCYALKGKGNINQYFLYFITKQITSNLKKFASGAVFDAITVSTFKSIMIIHPSSDLLDEFNSIVEPLFKKISINMLENNKLVELRDSLLPKLISGQIRIPEQELEEVRCLQKTP